LLVHNNTIQLRETLLQPEDFDLCTQYARPNPKLNTTVRQGRCKPGYIPNYKFRPRPAGQTPISAPRIIEEQSALTRFSKAYHIKYGLEDEATLPNRCKPVVIYF
jgi:hypothetical protein